MEQRLHWREKQTGHKAAAAQDQMESKGGLQHGLERAHNRHYSVTSQSQVAEPRFSRFWPKEGVL
eukprot:551372-Ditylum_brightwellii.AAC.1